MRHFRFQHLPGAPGTLIKLMGWSFLILGILIMIFPDLLAWLVGIMLVFNGLLLLGLGIKTKQWEKRYHQPPFDNFYSNKEDF